MAQAERVHREGLKLTLSPAGHGLTVNKQGRPLLPHPFVFQCGPLDQFTVTHAQNFGTYDTIDDDQFIRRGSRQLPTWQFDTLAMYLGADVNGKPLPRWVPFPEPQPHSPQYQKPEWYVNQLLALHDAGSPFRFAAVFTGSTTIRRTFAVLTGFSEVYKHGEGDTIYFSGVTFSEWRDPGDATKTRHAKLPAHVRFRATGSLYVAYEANTGRTIPRHNKNKGSTLSDLARWFYGDGTKWRQIAKANHLKGGDGNVPIFKHWYPHRLTHGKPNVTVTVPKEQAKPNSARTPPASGKTKAKR